jgi:hypothetical protein
VQLCQGSAPVSFNLRLRAPSSLWRHNQVGFDPETTFSQFVQCVETDQEAEFNLFSVPWRLYVAYHCPYAQRAWIARNYKVPPPPLFFDSPSLSGVSCWSKRKRIFSLFPSSIQRLQDKIKIVAIDLADRPSWYKEKVYPENKVCLVNLPPPPPVYLSCTNLPPSVRSYLSAYMIHLQIFGRCLPWSTTTRWKERAWIWLSTLRAISKARHCFLM